MRLGILTVLAAILHINCDDNTEAIETPKNTKANKEYTLTFKRGEALSDSDYKNIYVIWAENTEADYIQNLFICNKLIVGDLTGTALPYWKLNKYPNSNSKEVDAVTAATQANTDFSLNFSLSDTTITKFTLYFEVDHSFDANDWFSDQPALLYAVSVDLNTPEAIYNLVAIGWTPNENTENTINNTLQGNLQPELKYITHKKDINRFGVLDQNRATLMVNEIYLKIK